MLTKLIEIVITTDDKDLSNSVEAMRYLNAALIVGYQQMLHNEFQL